MEPDAKRRKVGDNMMMEEERRGEDVKDNSSGGSYVDISESGPVDKLILALVKTKVETLRPKTIDVIKVCKSDLISDVFRVFTEFNILSVPVLNNRGKYHSFLDTFDLVSLIVGHLFNDSLIDCRKLENLFKSEDNYNKTLVSDIVKYPRVMQVNGALPPVLKGYSLYTAFERLTLSNDLMKNRLAVVDDTGNIIDIITESMLLDFVFQNLDKVGTDLKLKLVRNLKKSDSKEPLIAIPASSKAITGFKAMLEHEIGGVAVVDDTTGWLLDTLTLRDLRGIRFDALYFWRLWDPVHVFKEKIITEDVKYRDVKDQAPSRLIYALETDNWEDCIRKMILHNIHRLYVVDSEENRKPMRVITQKDLLRELIEL